MMLTRRAVLHGIAAGPTQPGAITDAEVVEQAFRALHPGLLRYNTPSQIDRLFRRLHTDMGAARGPTETWLALSRFAAALRCGHTFVNGANQEGPGLAFLEAGRTRLPFSYRWLGGRMIVTDPGPVSGLNAGDEVTALADAPTRTLLPKLMSLAAADGAADGKRIRLAELDGRELWPLPDVALPILAPTAFTGGVVALSVRPVGGGGRRSTVAPLWTRAERLTGRGSDKIAPDGPAWRSKVTGERVRILTMPTWALYNSRWDWRGWLDAEVDAAIADGAPGIVLDLRGNSGGEDCGDHLLTRLIDREIVRPNAERFVRYRQTPPALNRYLTTWDKTFRDWGAEAHGPDARGFYRMMRWDTDGHADVIRPRGRRFEGRLVILIDATNSSATFQFAQTVKAAKLGVLVGETTGGNRRGINGGAFFFLRLPQSGFEIDLPLVATFPASPQPDAGITPDVHVAPTGRDFAMELDRQGNVALKIAASGAG